HLARRRRERPRAQVGARADRRQGRCGRHPDWSRADAGGTRHRRPVDVVRRAAGSAHGERRGVEGRAAAHRGMVRQDRRPAPHVTARRARVTEAAPQRLGPVVYARGMAVIAERNQPIVDEFRANDGRVGGGFAGAPIVLLHHRGRHSGEEYISPMMYLRDEHDADTIYVFASAGGRPRSPGWYFNLVAAPTATVEVGSDTYEVSVRELRGDERDRTF